MILKIQMAIIAVLFLVAGFFYVRSNQLSTGLELADAAVKAEQFAHEITTARLNQARELSAKQVADITKLTQSNLNARREVFSLSSRIDELRTVVETSAPETETPVQRDPNAPLPSPQPSFADDLSRLAADANRLLERSSKPSH